MKSRRQCYLRRREEEEGGRRMEKRAPPAAVVALAAFFSEKEAEKLSAKGQLKVNEGRESRKTEGRKSISSTSLSNPANF